MMRCNKEVGCWGYFRDVRQLRDDDRLFCGDLLRREHARELVSRSIDLFNATR